MSNRKKDKEIASAIRRSWENSDDRISPILSIEEWIDNQQKTQKLFVEIRPLNQINSWDFDSDHHSYKHASGKFFSFNAIAWNNSVLPMIIQPEIGILGLTARIKNGVFEILIQAKNEPGNINGIQISPTVQATKSNYTGVHKGKLPLYLEYFLSDDWVRSETSILIDQFQSEQGRRYLKKKNRNAIIINNKEIHKYDNFEWITLGQLNKLLKRADLVNSCLRSIVATMPMFGEENPYWSDRELCSMFRFYRETKENIATIVGLNKLKNWNVTKEIISPCCEGGIGLIGVKVRSKGREVSEWSQPLVVEGDIGEYGAAVTTINGERHWIVRFVSEPGLEEGVEWGPAWIKRDNAEGSIPQYWMDGFDDAKIVHDSIQSEEGGRFFQARFRHVVKFIPYSSIKKLPKDCVYVGQKQIKRFMGFGSFVTIELRSLIACATDDWWD